MAFYNLKKKPALTTKEGETETMYADIVYSGTIPAERLIRGVAKRTGFKEGVIEGILIELKEDVLQYLGEGYRVELGEFGFFSAKVKASRLVANKNDIRSESVAFNGVNFRASKSRTTYTELTGRLKNTALDDLKSFAAEGIIKREGRGNQMHFIALPRKEPDGE